LVWKVVGHVFVMGNNTAQPIVCLCFFFHLLFGQDESILFSCCARQLYMWYCLYLYRWYGYLHHP
jgi:hypothetical protein